MNFCDGFPFSLNFEEMVEPNATGIAEADDHERGLRPDGKDSSIRISRAWL